MSYQLFKFQVLSNLYPKHSDRVKQARVLAQAYNTLVLNHYEPLTGGGKFLSGTAKVPLLTLQLQQIFDNQRRTGTTKINIFSLMKPAIDAYWTGMTCVGPLGAVIVTSTGNFSGPSIPNHNSDATFMDIFSAVFRVHLLTLSGNYINYVTGATTPWSGATLLSLP